MHERCETLAQPNFKHGLDLAFGVDVDVLADKGVAEGAEGAALGVVRGKVK
jgi:hypothetical protein